MSSSSLVPFAFDDALIRVHTDESSNPWFAVKDVAKALEYAENSNSARLVAHVPDEWKGVNPIHTLGGVQELLFLTEHGLYFFLARSDKPKALPFQKWLAGEVLPALRKTGSYSAPGRSARTALPEKLLLPEEALALRPSLRERLWNDALQTARLDNGSSDDALRWFTALCGMVSARQIRPGSWEAVRQFMAARLMPATGRRLDAAAIYQDLRRWWTEQGYDGQPPSQKILGEALKSAYHGRNSNGRYYLDVAFRLQSDEGSAP